MKKIALIGVLTIFTVFAASAQVYSLHDNYIKKGAFAVNASYLRSYKSVIQKAQYRTDGAEIGGIYYLFDKVALKSGIGVIHYNKLDPRIDQLVYDQDNLFQVSNQIRYHFYDKTHCGTMFIQSGYRFGKFDETKEKLKAWEIASFGASTPLLRKLFTNLSWEGTVGIQKDNLHDKPVFPWQLGLNYYFGITNN